MGFLSNIFAGGVKDVVDSVASVADRFIQTQDEKAQFTLEVEKVITERLTQIETSARAETTATMEIIKAEMAQGDNYTKRARPTVVYAGLALTLINYVVAPIVCQAISKTWAPPEVPSDFWYVWGGICSAWVIGRTAERVGVKGKITSIATGSRYAP